MPDKRNEKINANIQYLYETILKVETVEECEALFDDLCTKTELASISQRLVVAKMLSEDCVYNKIIEETGASTATISRVNKSLEHGADGYKLVLARLAEK